MGIGCRRFIVDDEGRIVRLKNTLFERLQRDPQHHTMPALAGQRVRMAEILVQLAERRPICVVRRVYYVASFDGQVAWTHRDSNNSNGHLQSRR